ncbi:translation initiation factor IF-2-like [Lemur catta]|uniref:translation initiation factor IF-2-like n=1 Tax=Lemur catta TaxID=9447 RepID=UPI001E26A80C|nr:translation initiation factor IF-2-like [Lemur catta]
MPIPPTNHKLLGALAAEGKERRRPPPRARSGTQLRDAEPLPARPGPPCEGRRAHGPELATPQPPPTPGPAGRPGAQEGGGSAAARGERGLRARAPRRPSSPQARARIPSRPPARPRPHRRPTSASALRPRPPAAAAQRTHLPAARTALAGCWLASCFSAAAAARVDPPPTPGREPRRFAGAAPGLAPCRPLIGAPSRPLGREARRPSAARGAHGRRRERRRKGRRPSAAGRAVGRAGRGESRATASPPPFAFGPLRLPAGPAAPAANQGAGSSGCEPRVWGLESEGRRRSLIGPASPVEREALFFLVDFRESGDAISLDNNPLVSQKRKLTSRKAPLPAH